MNVPELVRHVKRRGRFGDINTTSDQVTADIIQLVNNGMFRMWRKWPWDWILEDISIAASAAEDDYTLASTIGDILVLDAGNDDYLRSVSLKRYLQWLKRSGESKTKPTNYIRLGRDSSGNLKIRLWPTPDVAMTITGWGKKRITEVSVADIAASTAIAYFPKETHDVIAELVLAGVYELQGEKAAALVQDRKAEGLLSAMIPEEQSHPDTEIQRQMPDYMIKKRRSRGGTTVV